MPSSTWSPNPDSEINVLKNICLKSQGNYGNEFNLNATSGHSTDIHYIRQNNNLITDGKPNMLLDWKTVKSKLPWGVVLLISGGYALAEATEVRLHLREQMEQMTKNRLRFMSNIKLYSLP